MRTIAASLVLAVVGVLMTVVSAFAVPTCITAAEFNQVQVDMRKSYVHNTIFDGYPGYHSTYWVVFPHEFDRRLYDKCNDSLNYRITYVKSASTDPSVWRVSSKGVA